MANDPKTQRPTLTTAAGIPVGDNQNSLTAGPRGPLLVQDWQLFEKHAHFNRERIPERVVHAKGSAAFGTLTITNDITRHSKAQLFAEVGKKTDVLLRFSTVAGEKGAADAERDVRGFALKFYTEEGNWDLVGNNTPVFFVRDPYKFPDFIHTQKRDPRTNLRNATAMWDFWSLSPESLHQVTILFSDRGLPKNYRQMHGFGSHTYSFINASNERVWVKFHFKSLQGIANITEAQSASTIGADRESHQRDLVEAIDRGEFPRWRMMVQLMSEDQAKRTAFDPFDLTKVWVKFHFKSLQGIANITDAQSAATIGGDRESHQRDLYEAIERREFPRWRMMVQLMSEDQAKRTAFDPFDLTKVWPHKEFPLVEVGILELNRNPENYFAEVEQASFSPANVVPGISHSPDKMLQFRVFSYADAHRHRLGVNYESLPVNQPRCPVHNYHRDGAMRFDGNEGGKVNYEPNSFGGPAEDHRFKEPPLPLEGPADRYDHRAGNDDYTQAGNLYRLMTPEAQGRLMDAIAGAMKGVPDFIQQRQIGHFAKADPAYGAGVAARLGLAGQGSAAAE